MAGTTAYAAKKALIDALTALAVPLGSLAGVKVTYSYSGKAHGASREYIYAGRVDGAVRGNAPRASSGRIQRQEDLVVQLHILVDIPGEETTDASDARAVQIGTVVEEYLAANPESGVDGVLFWQVVGTELDGAIDDEGAQSVLTYQIAFMSYLA